MTLQSSTSDSWGHPPLQGSQKYSNHIIRSPCVWLLVTSQLTAFYAVSQSWLPLKVTPVSLYPVSLSLSFSRKGTAQTQWICTYSFPPGSYVWQLQTVASHKCLSDSYTSSYVRTSVSSGRSGHNILPEINYKFVFILRIRIAWFPSKHENKNYSIVFPILQKIKRNKTTVWLYII